MLSLHSVLQAREVQEMMAAAQRAGIPARLVLSDRDFTPEDYEALCKLDEKVGRGTCVSKGCVLRAGVHGWC